MANDKNFVIKNGLQAGRYLQTVVAMAANDVDLSLGTYFTKTILGATTLTFSNPPSSGTAVAFLLAITGDSSTITWPTSIKWQGGSTPTPTSTKDIYVFITIDGGTTYLGRRTAENLS